MGNMTPPAWLYAPRSEYVACPGAIEMEHAKP
jgi:hypothetical protein